ncbi:MAG: M1 family metallopeptidase [Candidatus Hodarchaeota archaeon]
MNYIYPIHYKILVEPDLDSFTFKGTTIIEIKAENRINQIVLNANDLAFWSCKVKSNGDYVDCSFSIDPKAEEVTIKLPGMMDIIRLKIDYDGKINNLLVGFYRSKYEFEGKEKYVAVTQFGESHARRAFPCFDHPSKKATFDIEFVIDENLKGISNTPIVEEKYLGNGKKLVRFERTPKMCTYLIFFGVGDFEFTEDASGGFLVRVATTPGKSKYSSFGLEFGRKSIKFGEDYTGIKFPIGKMDLIAVPDFAFGAMENFGAIAFRENLLLVYPDVTSKAGIERIAEVMAHEIAHQWFGNLVSFTDWKYVWLKESFATFFAYFITNHYYPEWRVWDRFVSGETNAAFERDSLVETLPIELPSGEKTHITSATAPIVYSKAASILRMIKGYLGDENFKNGIGHFLEKFEFSCASTPDYWEAFEEATGEPINEVVGSWVYQPGYPLVEVKREGNELIFTQCRFTFLPDESDQTWIIPIIVILFYNNGESKTLRTLLKDKSSKISISENVATFKVNVEQIGFYRVKYEKKELEELGKLVLDKKLSPLDRFGLQSDLYALVRNFGYSIDDYLGFVDNYYHEEDEYLPLIGISNNLMNAYLLFESRRDRISSIGRKIFKQVFDKIGYEPKDDEEHLISVLRDNLLWAAFTFGDEEVAKFGVSKFQELFDGKTIHPDIMASILKIGAASDEWAFDYFIEKLETPDTPEHEKINILMALGCFKNKESLLKALNYTLEKVPSKNNFFPLRQISKNLVILDDLWDWFLDNLETLEKLHPILFGRVIVSLIPLAGLGKETEVKDFFKNYMSNDTIKMVIEMMEINSRLRNVYFSSTNK